MKHIGMARLGREAEMRALNDGTPVLNLSPRRQLRQEGPGRQPAHTVD
jgi:hypothetical protein